MPVLVPVVIWLNWTGHPEMGTFLLIWTVVTDMLDNDVRPVLITEGVDLPLLVITAGLIFGLGAFGANGLFRTGLAGGKLHATRRLDPW